MTFQYRILGIDFMKNNDVTFETDESIIELLTEKSITKTEIRTMRLRRFQFYRPIQSFIKIKNDVIIARQKMSDNIFITNALSNGYD